MRQHSSFRRRNSKRARMSPRTRGSTSSYGNPSSIAWMPIRKGSFRNGMMSSSITQKQRTLINSLFRMMLNASKKPIRLFLSRQIGFLSLFILMSPQAWIGACSSFPLPFCAGCANTRAARPLSVPQIIRGRFPGRAFALLLKPRFLYP